MFTIALLEMLIAVGSMCFHATLRRDALHGAC